MTINKFLLPQSYVSAIKRLYKNYRRKQRIKSFLKGADSPGDVINAYQLFLSMELPFQQRPKEVLDQIAATGKSSITLRHQYFQNTAIEFDLLDNFQMAICREFFIENIYDLTKVGFEPSLVIDCGGYKGYFTWLAREKFAKAKFICIEAHRINYNDIVRTAVANRIDNVDILHAAISNSDQAVDFYFEGSSGSMENNFSVEAGKELVQPVNLYKMIEGYNNVLLKVDIEGAELDFFPGIIDSLPKKCAIFLETHDGWNSFANIRDRFIKNGFSLKVIRERDRYIDSFAQRL